ncbi:MAG: hypothetical protein QFB86_03680 [Patescibacteria group bacterium]|nr:hypothetical protein [Patescibacteria group bacterium]
MTTFKQLLSRSLFLGAATLMITAGVLMTPLVRAQSASDGPRDCDDNAVLRCGAYSISEVGEKYMADAAAKTIYHYFDISSTDVSQMGNTAVNGTVTKSGHILVGDKTVATDALTVGRQNIAGSQSITQNDTTFYTRAPGVSFNQESLPAYVVMKNGQFQYAVIKSCGNPVKATPIVQTPAPVPTPPPAPTPAPTPPPTPTASSANCQLINVVMGENRQVSVTVNTASTNAQITGYSIDFGDGSAPAVVSTYNTYIGSISTASADMTPQNESLSSQSIEHQYAKDGNYTIIASIQARYADGRTETKTSETCKRTISFNTTITPAATPPTPAPSPAPTVIVNTSQPQVLPNTGVNVAQTLGISTVIGIISALGYLGFMAFRTKLYV